jgi:hypothetical protein
MAVTILDDGMSSDRTLHTARLTAGDRHSWEVPWLPGRPMNRNSAITAMMLADVTGHGDVDAGHRLWPHVSGWAAELALTAPEALTQLANPPRWANVGRSEAIADPEAAE